jgi:hypothetical protein
LVTLLACGGGGGSSPAPAPTQTATTISYTNPTGIPATSYYLTKNVALSTPGSHLVLDLYGPATTVSGSGVVLTLDLDTAKAAWSSVTAGGAPVANGSVLTGNANGAPVVKGKVNGGNLQVVVTEPGTASPKTFNGPLLQIALDMKAGLPAGTVVRLAPDLAKSKVLLGSMGPLSDLQIGTITLQ